MVRADIFALYDTAQFSKNEFHNRNRIKTASGVQWLTVPVRRPALRPIRSVRIASSWDLGGRHLRALDANYRRAPFYASYSEELSNVFSRNYPFLSDLNSI